MESAKKNAKDYYVIDIAHILKTIWYRAWVVVLSGLLAAGIGFSVSAFLIAPLYSSSIMLYVNNSSFSLNDVGFSISSSEITAAQDLVKTYTVLLKNRTTLQRVIDKVDLDYSYEELYNMIAASSVNGTEVLKVTVTTDNPEKSAKIANCIAEVLPQRISEIVEGSSMEVVDLGVVNNNKVSPSITKYTAAGLVIGVAISVISLAIVASMDNTIHDYEYVLQTYDYPILAKVPDLLSSSSKRYGYYYQNKKPEDGEQVSKDDE